MSPTTSASAAATRPALEEWSVPDGWTIVLERGLGADSWAGPTEVVAVSAAGERRLYGPFDPGRASPSLRPSPDQRSLLISDGRSILLAPFADLADQRTIVTLRENEFLTGLVWSSDSSHIAYSIGAWTDSAAGAGEGSYRFWVGEQGGDPRLFATIQSDGPLHATAFDAAHDIIFALRATEAGQIGGVRAIGSSGRVEFVAGLQSLAFRHGFVFTDDFRTAYWAEQSGNIVRFDVGSAGVHAIWQPPRPFAWSSAISSPDRAWMIIHGIHQDDTTLVSYLVSLRAGWGKPAFDSSQYPGIAAQQWSADSRFVFLQPQCDRGCEPHLGNAGETYLLEPSSDEPVLFHRSSQFDERGEPIDWIRFIAWLRNE